MGLVTIDPHSQKEHTEIHKILKFGVNQASFTEIQRFKNVKISKLEVYDHPDAVSESVQAPVVQRLDNAIHWINRYPADKC